MKNQSNAQFTDIKKNLSHGRPHADSKNSKYQVVCLNVIEKARFPNVQSKIKFSSVNMSASILLALCQIKFSLVNVNTYLQLRIYKEIGIYTQNGVYLLVF